MNKLKSCIFLPFVIFLFSLLCPVAWGASGSVTITSPDPNQVYETETNFTVKGTYRMDSNDSGSIWVPAGDSRLPNCTYGGWIYPGGYYNGDWGEETIGIVNYTVDGVNKGQIGDIWSNVWGYDNIGDDNSFNASVKISGLDTETDHTVVINLQKAWGARCYNPNCHGYGCDGSWTLFQINGDIIDSKTLNFRIVTPCNLKINSFSGNKEVIDPSAGESVTFTGDMTETSGKTVTWTATITDSSGASIGRTFSGTGKNPSITWDGKDSFGKIVDDGLYTGTLDAQTEDGKCKKSASAQVTVKSTCGKISLTVSPSDVRPQKTGQDDKTATTVSISLSKPAPSSGCDIKLRVKPVDKSGGHNHTENRESHVGSLSSSFAFFVEGESSMSVQYTSGEVGGTEEIVAELVDSNGKITSSASIPVDIKVDGLSPLISTSNVLSCGGTTKHSAGNNNYGTSDTLNAVYAAITNYANKYHALYLASDICLAVIDMSLPDGGLFDIKGNWGPKHYTHKEGKSADFSSYYKDSCDNSVEVTFYNQDGTVYETTNTIDSKLLDNVFAEQDCARKERDLGLIHYECTK